VEYLARLQEPFYWDLSLTEQEIAVRMAKQHGGETVMKAWHAFQRFHPLAGFDEFEKYFDEYRYVADQSLSLTAMFAEHLQKRGESQ